jgi:hypothetical protein
MEVETVAFPFVVLIDGNDIEDSGAVIYTSLPASVLASMDSVRLMTLEKISNPVSVK